MDTIVGTPTNITTAGAVQVLKSRGVFHRLVINKADAHAIALYDSASASPASSELIGTIAASVAAQTLEYSCAVARGLVVVPVASYAGDITVVAH